MPIYEYLCPACNRVYSFLAKTASEEKQPVCPKCGAGDLRKMVSKFAVVGGTKKAEGGADADPDAPPGDGDGLDGFDDPRVEREMTRLMQQAEDIDENDPRQLGQLMRRMSEITGEKLDPEMQEAVRRLEAGEDPEKIEEDMGDLLGDEEGMGGGGPTYDDGLYPM